MLLARTILNSKTISRSAGWRRTCYLAVKRCFDFTLALFSLFALSPLFAVIALLVKLDSPGPVFFSQQRVGLHGRLFNIYKFRSMHAGVDPYAPSPKSSGDPRITRTGRFLRRKSLDELPQLFNILRGDMSFVGPRPEMPFLVQQYDADHRARLSVKPGLTGLWQISNDRNAGIGDLITYDLCYIENQCFRLDMLIIIDTFLYILRGKEGCFCRSCRLAGGCDENLWARC